MKFQISSCMPVIPYLGFGIGFYNSTLKFDAGDSNPTTDFVGNQRVTDNGDFTNGYKRGGFGLHVGYRL